MPDQPKNELTQPVPMEKTQPIVKIKRWPWIIAGVVIFLIFTLIGVLTGYQNGINQRKNYESSQTLVQASTQFDLGVVDVQEGRLQMALSRFEYVITLNPSFPGVQEKLAEVLTALNLTKVPNNSQGATSQPTVITSVTPTADNGNKDQLFQQIQSELASKSWSNAITDIQALRKLDITYQTARVDGMYYLALQSEGVQLITTKGLLEQGLYDLALAQTIGPLNDQATTYQTWAKLYLAGAAYWEVDWSMVLSYFEPIYQALPYLMDANGVTAQQRYEEASVGYADSLVKTKDYCKAQKYYEAAQQLSSDTNLSATLTADRLLCSHSTGTPASNVSPTSGATLSPTATPITAESPTAGLPSETPTKEIATATIEPSPTNTNTPDTPTTGAPAATSNP